MLHKENPDATACQSNDNGLYMLGRINDILSNNNLSKHKKILNIWLLTNDISTFPDMPPDICTCKIVLKNGSQFKAYVDSQQGKYWIEYGNTFAIKRNGRRRWQNKDVSRWEFV